MKYERVRRLPPFDYFAPSTLDEVLSLMAEHGDSAKFMAGGTDLLPKMKRRHWTPRCLIGLENVKDLSTISYSGGTGLRFGPMVTLHEMEKSPLVRQKYGALHEGASVIGSAQIRNAATVMGNLCSAVPSADMAPGLLVLEGAVKLVSSTGERTVLLQDFFAGPSKTVMRPDELALEVSVPDLPARSISVYLKHTLRGAMELAIVGVAVMITLEDGVCREARIGLGAVAPTPIRAFEAESLLKGKALDSKRLEKAAQSASDSCAPISDIRAPADYRREMVRTLVHRAFLMARQELGGKNG